MNKKQITLGMLATAFCASAMLACGKYGSPEKYREYKEENKESETSLSKEDDLSKKIKENNYYISSIISAAEGRHCNVYGPPERYHEYRGEINNE